VYGSIARSLPIVTLAATALSCGGLAGGTSWVNQPLGPDEQRASYGQRSSRAADGRPTPRLTSRALGAREQEERADAPPGDGALGGRVLGTFRNTYYDFPNEADYAGASVALKSSRCETIAMVPRGFHDAVCVQGSGSLARGGTVSFARRDCACADVCPRTKQRICFDALDEASFPWGRGAAGVPITPLRSVAADPQVLPLGTVLYLPELDGVRGASGGPSDGCFVVEDRGLKVQGEHIDVFTGHPSETAALNAQVPSNRGVTVIVDSPRCAHLAKR
jgi:3D (Asp-Asp-Asp) domain-containing protein